MSLWALVFRIGLLLGSDVALGTGVGWCGILSVARATLTDDAARLARGWQYVLQWLRM